MNKNVFLAILLSIGIYFLWTKWMQKQYPDYYSQKEKTTINEQKIKTEDFGVTEITKETSLPEAEKPSRTIEFEIKNISMVFNSNGAGIASYKFEGPVETAELIPFAGPGFFATMENLVFKLKRKENNHISFIARPAKGITVDKSYKWDSENGLNNLTLEITNQTGKIFKFPKWHINIGPGLGTVKNQQKENTKIWKSVFAVKEKGRKHPSLKKLKKEAPQGPWLWAGIQNRYFLAAVIGDENHNFNLKYKETLQEIKNKAVDTPSTLLEQMPSILEPKGSIKWEIDFYFGPKDYRKLSKLGYGLGRSVEFGFFSQLGKLAMKVLYFNYGLTKNYGWSIIILTIMVQFLMFPLTYKSSKSMMVMKKLQPEMKLIQEKYKKDPKRLQQETMSLYKKHGANPFGGCLPMLVQIPIFFALFTALRNSWDLHGAGWIFWIRDLSAKDPFYVLPIVMGAMMFLQQKITMPSADKSQAAMFKFMPLIFTFMFLSFPSGLVLYWLTSNVISFFQQLYLRKIMPQSK